MEVKISYDKKYQTISGLDYKLYEIYKSENNKFCVHGAIKNLDGEWYPVTHDIYGRYSDHGNGHDYDLMEIADVYTILSDDEEVALYKNNKATGWSSLPVNKKFKLVEIEW